MCRLMMIVNGIRNRGRGRADRDRSGDEKKSLMHDDGQPDAHPKKQGDPRRIHPFIKAILFHFVFSSAWNVFGNEEGRSPAVAFR
jgi:hypothetical protein